MGSGITLANNEIEYIIKVIQSLENRGILLRGTTEKINNQDGGFLGNFLGSLMKVGLSLMKNVLTPLTRLKTFVTINVNGSSVSAKCRYSKENL